MRQGWSFKEGDTIRLELDYNNQNLVFFKNYEDDDDDDDVEVYEMPVRVDEGPIYAFVSLQHIDSEVSIV